jgi:hypothetical protein
VICPRARCPAAKVADDAAFFMAYLVIGFAMPVLPVHAHQGLGLSTIV